MAVNAEMRRLLGIDARRVDGEGVEDPVKQPAHYVRGGIEAIDVIEAWGLGFHLGNALKYIARAGHKGEDAQTDLEKARWYLDREIRRRFRRETEKAA